MKKSTLLQLLFAIIPFLAFVCAPEPALAQHGGGHAGGGGGHAGGGAAGGYHGGASMGGYHGGGYGGGYAGRGGYSGGSGPRGPYGSGSASPSGAQSRPWSWEGRAGSRDTSPGFHGFSGNNASASRSGSINAATRPGVASAGRSAANFTPHEAAADGNWHSFAAGRGTTELATVTHVGMVGSNSWHAGVWGTGFRGYGWGWGHPGWNWGWGWGWGCCGSGWGWGGWGLGFGWGWGWGGWGIGWSPFWAWPPYYYSPWPYAYSPAPDVVYPYPD